MSEYRVMLEGGDVLIVTLEVKPGETVAEVDPMELGRSILDMFGLGRRNTAPTVVRAGVNRHAPRQKIVRSVEPDADAWLQQQSHPAMRNPK